MSIPQLYNVVVALETLVYLAVDKENVMKHPRPYKICQHNLKQKECRDSHDDVLCPTVEEVLNVKYMYLHSKKLVLGIGCFLSDTGYPVHLSYIQPIPNL